MPAPHALPMAMHVPQQRVSLPHPLLLTLPSGMVVRQKMAPPRLVEPLNRTPLRLASIRHALPRLAPRKLAPEASAPTRLIPPALQPVQLTFFRALVPAKSQFWRLAPEPGTQGFPLKHRAAAACTGAWRRRSLPLPLPRRRLLPVLLPDWRAPADP